MIFFFTDEEREEPEFRPAESEQASGRVPEEAASSLTRPQKRSKQSRGTQSGPFIISPIVPASGQTGWGAICGLHRDRNDSKGASCKKALSLSICGGSHEVCKLRLKRWLHAGLDDKKWPRHTQRSHHLTLGGKGLIDFAEGLLEEELDRQIQALG